MDDAPIGDHFQFHCTCDNKNKDILFYSILFHNTGLYSDNNKQRQGDKVTKVLRLSYTKRTYGIITLKI